MEEEIEERFIFNFQFSIKSEVYTGASSEILVVYPHHLQVE
jgi:hypothetical protein